MFVLSVNEGKYQMLIARLPDAFAYCKAVLNEAGKPEDFLIVDTNESFIKFAGLSRGTIIGRTVTEALPGFTQTDPDWFSAFEQVAITGNSICLEIFSRQDNHWFDITAYSDSPGYVAAVLRDITKRKLFDEKTSYYSFHDRLTGLFNRYYLEEEMHRLDTDRQLPISIIFSDVNGLKLVNDIFGHSTGDEMLLQAAEILTLACREEDIIVRWGGDEFVILLPQTGKNEVENVCKRINDKCKAARIRGIPLSIALGTAIKNNAEENILEVLETADYFMYKNKSIQALDTKKSFFNALFTILEKKSHETDSHIKRMQRIALKLGERLRFSETELNNLVKLTILHDIGKISIPKEILLKNSPITVKEWQVIKRHPETGYRIARTVEELAPVAEDILCHHERWDGMGYPRGLKKENIPLLARVAAIADAYEVMTRGRPYKRPINAEAAVAELNKQAGYHFDPQLVGIFNAIVEEDAGILAFN